MAAIGLRIDEARARNERLVYGCLVGGSVVLAAALSWGGYKRHSLDTAALPTETEGGALRRVAEPVGANGESHPSYVSITGHSVPSAALERNKSAGNCAKIA